MVEHIPAWREQEAERKRQAAEKAERRAIPQNDSLSEKPKRRGQGVTEQLDGQETLGGYNGGGADSLAEAKQSEKEPVVKPNHSGENKDEKFMPFMPSSEILDEFLGGLLSSQPNIPIGDLSDEDSRGR
ncbi:hypothetical protein FACS1894191_8580 [Clostridia bacterium]|nr:hypothetical protein FACS1894191_8580 [Clostridia bacterium]